MAACIGTGRDKLVQIVRVSFFNKVSLRPLDICIFPIFDGKSRVDTVMHKAGQGVSRTIDRADIFQAVICLYIWLRSCMLRLQRTVLPILRLTTAAVEQTPCTMANVFALSSASRMFSYSTGISTTGLRVSQALRLIAMPPLARVPTALQNGRSSSRFSTALRATSNNRNLSALAAAVSCSGTSPTMLDKTCARFNNRI